MRICIQGLAIGLIGLFSGLKAAFFGHFLVCRHHHLPCSSKCSPIIGINRAIHRTFGVFATGTSATACLTARLGFSSREIHDVFAGGRRTIETCATASVHAPLPALTSPWGFLAPLSFLADHPCLRSSRVGEAPSCPSSLLLIMGFFLRCPPVLGFCF